MVNRTNPTISWERDFHDRVNPSLITQLLHRSVPVLKQSDWQVTEVEYGRTKTQLPLNQATTNQHGTHQAALISLSADYTGGLALTTLLTGVPIAGVHKSKPEESASLWLASMDVKYLKPSTGHLTGRCHIDKKTADTIVNRYFSNKRVLSSLRIDFESNGERVAEASLKYFAQPTSQLLDCSGKRSALFNQKIKASARMIAGVRANRKLYWSKQSRLNTKGKILRFDSPLDKFAAGPHGRLLAKKLTSALPQLTNMVLARTEHSDEIIRSIPGLRQIVLVGAGLDMRAFRHAHIDSLTCFEIDLPEMLAERDRILQQLSAPQNFQRVKIPADFLRDNLTERIYHCEKFDPKMPTAFIYEGCSMYFNEETNRKIFKSIKPLMKNPASRLWADFVDRQVVDGPPLAPEVGNFLQKMDDLGESFIFGKNDPCEFLQSCGYLPSDFISARDYLGKLIRNPKDESVYNVYYFTTSQPDGIISESSPDN